MPKKNKNKSDGLEIALNSAIAISGVILLGFLYSFSQNQLHDGIEIEPTVNYNTSQPILAKDNANGKSFLSCTIWIHLQVTHAP